METERNEFNPVGGFINPQNVPTKFLDFFKKHKLSDNNLLSRAEVTKFIFLYIKNNKLLNEFDKRMINLDDELKNLFNLSIDDEIKISDLQKYINSVYLNE